MNTTPNANRIHITFIGKTNSGKSSLMNAIIGQDISIVSPIEGTTTDPVSKSMELIPLGPVLFTDTAGLEDNTELGKVRIEKTLNTLLKTDFAIYVMSAKDIDINLYKKTINKFKEQNISYITVINKMDIIEKNKIDNIKKIIEDPIFVSSNDINSILNLKDLIIKNLSKTKEDEDDTIIGNLLPHNSKVIMVIPIDSEAPKGRLILPQVQLIRDCLDHGIKSYVVRDTELKAALDDLKNVDLIITDSQAFKKVNNIVPKNIKLTSFSILLANYKGDLKTFVEGTKAINTLNENSKILISESCTHNYSHEDIGRVKIPNMINSHVDKKLNYEFKMGESFPQDVDKYDLIIHCGACMVNKKSMDSKLKLCMEKNVPITNYGILISYLTGILDRSIEVFNIKLK
ncbi:TPA: [FeFe] hydrogenase H-cluster maturation GTPase HydF [Clostridium botulinum]|uniref:[FeFe] hydrogenase H-cluster maturation GTPase HydF n=2 Tax=Clostridium botulinum TaxID=1491 RepID=UPI00099B7563|nr:[FeFe] hydrogenase H-cluster maturation GTPase HydF [Clostridium botulinum]NFA98471.1 [FeFe] hydrogenase H-cluster maturation GTPase HydF [Clostridium botulinum]NFB53227.1 [FeFe] hydrogenase H-cluster maturation GTPase HydF [Clostridium botulinum]NFC77489.1 [FeFe] hydrogenase H-cluster maturation GTPase HydF [Clostridium botulinum]NFC88365.1 [FeFe] hydrogenase H-cluster maturation GTPase HydF [Clostridium botulinum]NFD06932.1 [FeFe] hydrogenase H-cluster maturation GTPase HydF [Clostridium 